MKSPSPLRGCVSRSRMSGALEVMTLYYVNQTEFGVWVFGVHYLSANKVSQACEGPGVKHEGVQPREVETEEKYNGCLTNMALNKCLINFPTKQDFYELLQRPKSIEWSYKEAYLQQLQANLFCGLEFPITVMKHLWKY